MSDAPKLQKKLSGPASWGVFAGLAVCFLAATAFSFLILFSSGSSLSQSSDEGEQKHLILILGHGLAADHVVHKSMVRMGKHLKELSGGTMEIRIYPSGVIGSEDECFKQAQNAQIAFAKCSAAVLDGSVKEFQVVGAPFLFRNTDHFWAVMNGEIGQGLLQSLDKMKLIGICYFDAGARSLYTTKKPVNMPEHMRGLKIRTQKSRIAMDSMKALGSAPTPISWGELYTALQQGTVDAAENNIPSFVSGRHFEVCKYFIHTEHQRVPDVLVMSKQIWDSLTEQQQGWIRQAAAEANAYQRKAWLESEIENEKKAREAGVEFITVDRAPFMELSRPIYDAFSPELQELAERIKAVREIDWLTDFEEAKKRAAKEKKPILMFFTGSDWCGWCEKLHADVFDKDEFMKFALKNVILLELDFPKSVPQSEELRIQNKALGEKFKVDGYPTVALVTPDGEMELVRMTGYDADLVKKLRLAVKRFKKQSKISKTAWKSPESRKSAPNESEDAAAQAVNVQDNKEEK